MAAKRTKAAAKKKPKPRKKTARQKSGARKRLTPATSQRGLDATEVMLAIDSPEVSGLVETIRETAD